MPHPYASLFDHPSNVASGTNCEAPDCNFIPATSHFLLGPNINLQHW
jgi:hypothetical protein